MHAALDRAWVALDRALPEPPDAAWRMLVTTAAGEIVANIITYALRAAPGERIAMDVRLLPDRLVITFRDRGAPYAPPQGEPGPDDLDAILALSEHGRGIPLARAALDDLAYTRANGENIWALEKRFGAEG